MIKVIKKRMSTAACKAKGRRLQQETRDSILTTFADLLVEDDVRSTSMGSSGEDVQLSPRAREVFPFSVECKNTEKINIWSAIEQGSINAMKKKSNFLVIFRRNHAKANAVLEFSVLMQLLKENYELRKVINSNRESNKISVI